MSWLQATLARRALQSCRSFTTSAPSRLAGSPNVVVTNLLTRRRTFATAALLWGSALAIAAGMTLSSTVHADAATPAPPVEEETRVDPATSIAFPTTLKIQSKTPLPAFTLMGVGARTVSFLGIKVYSVGFYADLSSPSLAMVPKDATPEEKIDYIVKNTACVLRIIPTRSTSYSHLRDGFMRAMQARQILCRQRGELSPDEELAIQSPLRQLKSMFPNTPLAKHSPLDILVTAPSNKSRTLVVRDLGSVQNDWLAREFVLAYFEGKGISPPLKESVVESTSVPSSSSSNARLQLAVPPRSQTYATHANVNPASSVGGSKPTAASLLSSALDQKQRAARREDSAGPFTLGIVPPRPDEVKPEKKWSELSVGGKVVRTTARTTNLVVILAGAGLTVVLVYALTSELFSRNSPTVLYSKSCELIKASPQVHQYMQGRLVFHNHPPTLSRPRHRNHYVNSQIFVDSAGREHMLLNFYVQGRPPGSASYTGEEEDGFFTRMSHKTQLAAVKLGEMSFEDIKEEATTRGIRLVELTKGMFRFLTGEEDARPAALPVPVPEKKVEETKGWMSSVTGMFSGIKGSTRSGSSSGEAYGGPAFTEGEVHADLVMNDQGYYQFRYLLIDMPNSNTRNPRRVFIQRADGVRETEPIIRWHR
ncbi:hypothetical protein GSI_08270 [Ganoderma sinense ZZ0214-1]|uniref:Mitochondrial import inner membrane translocase subunit TIM21 n=1 Tax=Ganoderma sinense ZZ0214-1 TaxID=1077348 RepID=A0A2G8S781_9APHY|nr:hypothetical protein GSI_08270 [Ganoderma sinense ZZ0214-1]